MFEQVLPEETKKILAKLSRAYLFAEAYLAGGTAAALQLGHRVSHDLDFFTPQDFEAEALVQQLGTFSSFHLDRLDWKTVLGYFGRVKFSFFYYQYPLLAPVQSYEGIRVASLWDIAAMKINAIAQRGSRRDFVDLYFIITKTTVSLARCLELYDHKYQNLAQNRLHLEKSLVYFEDAEKEPLPEMLQATVWEDIKKFFLDGISRLR